MARRIYVFDTTLRDGEQAPGCSMNLDEKLAVARQLDHLGVDVIEAGFAVASPGDFTSVKEISRVVRGPVIASLARALEKDIDIAWDAVRVAQRPRIHTFIATSPIHMEHKLKMSPDQVIERISMAVKHARKLCPDVEFSAEDASRSDPEFLCKAVRTAIEAGATTINLPDTVGYSVPDEYAWLISTVRQKVPELESVILSVHCHNDLGLAVANTLAALKAGAQQVECTINGLGERAGNAALEEVVMGIHTRKDVYDFEVNIDTKQIYSASRLVSTVTGVRTQPNKAIVGDNAFAHESGIHQHGVLANKATYEIMSPTSIGLPQNKMILGKHSGRHAFEERLNTLGYSFQPAMIDKIFAQFKELADRKKIVSDKDIVALLMGTSINIPETYKLERFTINSGSSITATCAIRLSLPDGSHVERVAVGDGPIDAAFKAIDKIIGKHPVLEDFSLNAVTEGKDAQGEARVRILDSSRFFNGRGLSTDVVGASIEAYIAAINAMVHDMESVGAQG